MPAKKNTITDAPKKSKAAESRREIHRLEGTQLETWIDPTDRSTRTLFIHRSERGLKTFIYRADDGVLRYSSNGKEVKTAGELLTVVDPERLAGIPSDLRRPNNEDLFVKHTQHKDGCRYTFDELARWHAAAGGHLAPHSTPATPTRSAPAAKKASRKGKGASASDFASDTDACSEAGSEYATDATDACDTDACDTDAEEPDIFSPRKPSRKPSKDAIAAAMRLMMNAPVKPALKRAGKASCKLDFDAFPATGRVTKKSSARRVTFE